MCRFTLPGTRALYFNEGPRSANSTGRHLYQGAGTDRGECGLALANLTEEDNGLVGVAIETRDSDWESRLIPLIVARPPTPPTLGVTYNTSDVTATCSVQESRPLANITWMLGGEVVRQDSEDDSPGSACDAWRWPWMAGSTSQTLTRRLQPHDTGKRLKCSVSHVALTEPLAASEVISLTGTSEGTTPTTTPTLSSTTSGSQEMREWWVRASQLQNTCCLKDGAAAAAAQLAEEIGRLNLEAAKSRARQEEAKARAAELDLEAARTRAKIEEEKLLFEREMHRRQLQ